MPCRKERQPDLFFQRMRLIDDSRAVLISRWYVIVPPFEPRKPCCRNPAGDPADIVPRANRRTALVIPAT
ncbi:MAG: hypothetical protein KDA96_05800 [Planctomycetaceae bacterium]|nr:hypothetical protein [Planctomycetaceae bacterium]